MARIKITVKKHLLLPLMLIMIFSINAQEAQDDFDVSLNTGIFGGGMLFFQNEYQFELSATLPILSVEHNKTRVGFSFSPFNYTAFYSVKDEKWEHNMYFLNGSVYWDALKSQELSLSPFISARYLNLKNVSDFKPTEYMLDAGIRFSLRTYRDKRGVSYHIIGIEAAYRNISGRHGFYIAVTTDITALAYALFNTLYDDNDVKHIREANEEYERSPSGPFIPVEPKW
jgi:hypothetical protein